MKTRYLISFVLALWASALSAQSHWSFDYRQYQYSMTVYFELQKNGQTVVIPSNYEVAAFVGDECRGIATFETETGSLEQTLSYGFLKVYSNTASGESVMFKCYEKTTEEEQNIKELSVPFSSDAAVGLPSDLKVFAIEKIAETYTVIPTSNDNAMGSVEGGGEIESGNNTTVVATPAEGYHFVNWTIGGAEVSTESSYQFTVSADAAPKANFAPNQYTMTFVLDNGEENVVKTQDFASELTAPTDPVKTGFTFKGWSQAVPATVPSSDQTFTAQWERNSYKLAFVVDGVESSSNVLFEGAITAPEDPSKEGYTFTGWSPAVAETMPAEDVTYTAQFSINQYTMTFVLDNGEENVVKTQDFASELTAPTDPVKTGFTFKGWSQAVPATVPSSDQTFTAQWERNSYKLTFVVDGVESSSNVLFEGAITAPEDPSKEGYTFTGWSPAVAETMPAEDVTYTAQFSINQYTMTFVLDNGEENVVKTQDFASELTAPTDPVKTGFTFKGWSQAVPATVPSSDQTFTAQWERNSYKLTFVVDGVESSSNVLFEGAITAPEDPSKEGYTFTGWSPAVAETMPAEDVTYTAQFSINQYTMTFVLDNGEENVVKTQDFASELTAPTDPVKTGFTFKGWSQAVPATVPSSDQTFTAQWERNSYKLTFVVDGVESSSNVLFEGAITAPEDPSKEGYTFTGWTPAVAETMPAEDVTYTAQFSINQYTMTFVLDNGEENVVKTQDFASELTAPTDPVKTGFTFKGWSQAVPATVPSSDQTFTAQWERNSYKLTFVVDGVENTSNVLFEDAVTSPDDPVKEGYTFTGWSPEVPETMPAEDVTCTAQFSVNQYTIIYMVDGVEWERETVDYGATITLKEYTPAEGKVFNGWVSDQEYTTMPAHDVVYTANITVTGISAIFGPDAKVDVYNVNGTLVARKVAASQLQQKLPRGMYIINGKKMMVK